MANGPIPMTDSRITNRDNDYCPDCNSKSRTITALQLEIARLDEQWNQDGETIRVLRSALSDIACVLADLNIEIKSDEGDVIDYNA